MRNRIGNEIVNLLVLCLIAGIVLSAVSIDVLGFLRFLSSTLHHAVDIVLTAARWAGEYVLVGAIVVLPIYAIRLLLRRMRQPPGSRRAP
ncbi:MAG: hypothetical protein FJX68_08125 [Alphaproteobacteria bacterium]|nr:hypothetical protein [Alphaproteobacteria bacterium]